MKKFLKKHKWEIFFALAFALIALVVVEVFKPPFLEGYAVVSKLLSDKTFREKLFPAMFFLAVVWILTLIIIWIFKEIIAPKKELNRRAINETANKLMEIKEKPEKEPLADSVIRNAVMSNYKDAVPSALIGKAISNYNALCQYRGIHYANWSKTYHVMRRLDVLSILKDSSFSVLSEQLASGIDFSDIDMVLWNKKTVGDQASEKNQLFRTRFMEKAGIKIVPSIHYNEETRTISLGSIDPDNLDGKNVILLESLVVFPDTIIDQINGLQKSFGATVKKVIILIDGTFDGENSRIDVSSCGIEPGNVIIGSFIDLKLSITADCKCPRNTVLTTLKYDEY